MKTENDGTQVKSEAFDTSLYASTTTEKLKRSFQLGFKYYLYSIPKYYMYRNEHGLPLFDSDALFNPMREFKRTIYIQLELPSNLDSALEECSRVGIKFALPKERLLAVVGTWWKTRHIAGNSIEFGSYKGATFLLLALLSKMNNINQKFLLLDTFEGIPIKSKYDLNRNSNEYHPKEHQDDLIRNQASALSIIHHIEIHKGLFSSTIKELNLTQPTFAFVHIDANVYESTLEACQFSIPRISMGGQVVFDDYNSVSDLGARLAIDFFLSENTPNIKPQPLASCSAYMNVSLTGEVTSQT